MRLGEQLRAERGIAHDRQPLGHALVLDRLVGRGTSRTGCGSPAGPAARRSAAAPPAPWRHGPWPPAPRPGRAAGASRPAWNGACASDTENGRPDAVSSRSIISNSLSGLGVLKSEMNSMTPRARILHAERDAQELGLGGAQRRRRVALHGAVVEGARGREAERAVAHRLGRERAHVRHLLRRRLLEPGGALAHHEHAQCAVRQLGAEIHVARPRLQRIEILAERFPRPVQALVERRAGNILDAFHQLDQALAVLELDRREAHAAIAHHRRGDAMPARRLQVRIPGRLAVIVGVDVDEARRDQQALGVDLLGGAAGHLADGGDLAVLHGDVGLVQGSAGAVGQSAAAHDQIEFRRHVRFSRVAGSVPDRQRRENASHSPPPIRNPPLARDNNRTRLAESARPARPAASA